MLKGSAIIILKSFLPSHLCILTICQMTYSICLMMLEPFLLGPFVIHSSYMCDVAFTKSVTNSKIILYINIHIEYCVYNHCFCSTVMVFWGFFFLLFMFSPGCAFSAISKKSIFNVFFKVFLLIYNIVLLLMGYVPCLIK